MTSSLFKTFQDDLVFRKGPQCKHHRQVFSYWSLSRSITPNAPATSYCSRWQPLKPPEHKRYACFRIKLRTYCEVLFTSGRWLLLSTMRYCCRAWRQSCCSQSLMFQAQPQPPRIFPVVDISKSQRASANHLDPALSSLSHINRIIPASPLLMHSQPPQRIHNFSLQFCASPAILPTHRPLLHTLFAP